MENVKAEINAMTSRTELEAFIPLIRRRMESLVAVELTIGCQVYVVQKTKKTLGTVTKINKSRAVVELPQGSYRVPLSMLEVA